MMGSFEGNRCYRSDPRNRGQLSPASESAAGALTCPPPPPAPLAISKPSGNVLLSAPSPLAGGGFLYANISPPGSEGHLGLMREDRSNAHLANCDPAQDAQNVQYQQNCSHKLLPTTTSSVGRYKSVGSYIPSAPSPSVLLGRLGGALKSTAGAVAATVANHVTGPATTSSTAHIFLPPSPSELPLTTVSTNADVPQHLALRRYRHNTVIKEGFLFKWTNYLGKWQRRYFVIEPGVLKYRDGPGGRVKDSYPLEAVRRVNSDPARLDVIHPGGTLYLRTLSALETAQWADALKRSIKAFQLDAHGNVVLKGLSPFVTEKLKTSTPSNQSVQDICARVERQLEQEVDPDDRSEADERSPVLTMLENCQSARSSLRTVTEEINSAQTDLLNLAGRVRDVQFREDIRATTLRVVERLDWLSAVTLRHVSSTEALALEEQTQRKRLEKSVRAMAKKAYLAKKRLQRIQIALRDADVLPALQEIRGPSLTNNQAGSKGFAEETCLALKVANSNAKDLTLARDSKAAEQPAVAVEQEDSAPKNSVATVTTAESCLVNETENATKSAIGVSERAELQLAPTGKDNLSSGESTREGNEEHHLCDTISPTAPNSAAQGVPQCASSDAITTIQQRKQLELLTILRNFADVNATYETDPSSSEQDSSATASPHRFFHRPQTALIAGQVKGRHYVILSKPLICASPPMPSEKEDCESEPDEFFDADEYEKEAPSVVSATPVQPALMATGSGTTMGKHRIDLPRPRAEFKVCIVLHLALRVPTEVSTPCQHRSRPFLISLWNVLKDCIGRDLNRISVPVYFNEPTSMLQRLAEDFQYVGLLKKAAHAQTTEERLLWTALFTITPFASTIGRTYKPFNPLLGETFELSHRGYKLVAEQVGHHPPVSAYNVRQGDEFEAFGHISVNSRFTGRSLEISLPGVAHVVLNKQTDTAELLTYQRAKAVINNVIFGAFALIEYLRQGWFRPDQHVVRGVVLDRDGNLKYRLGGWWSRELWIEEIDLQKSAGAVAIVGSDGFSRRQGSFSVPPTLPSSTNGSPASECNSPRVNHVPATAPGPPPIERILEVTQDQKLYVYETIDTNAVFVNWDAVSTIPGSRRVVWRPDARPPTSSKYYEFGYLAFELNELSPEYDPAKGAVMPPTDCRFRPDQRYLEYGDVERATAEKHRLEEKQRAAARLLRSRGEIEHTPRWFRRCYDPIVKTETFEFTEEYWSCKSAGVFHGCPDLF